MQIYIYLCHNLEDCYLKYRLPIHLLNIMVLKVEKSEKNCQNCNVLGRENDRRLFHVL